MNDAIPGEDVDSLSKPFFDYAIDLSLDRAEVDH